MSARILVLSCLLITVLLITGLVEAQQPGKIFRIGFLDPSTSSGTAVLLEAFRQELGKLGWIEGKNITIVDHPICSRQHIRRNRKTDLLGCFHLIT